MLRLILYTYVDVSRANVVSSAGHLFVLRLSARLAAGAAVCAGISSPQRRTKVIFIENARADCVTLVRVHMKREIKAKPHQITHARIKSERSCITVKNYSNNLRCRLMVMFCVLWVAYIFELLFRNTIYALLLYMIW